jgi:hypothetical protein
MLYGLHLRKISAHRQSDQRRWRMGPVFQHRPSRGDTKGQQMGHYLAPMGHHFGSMGHQMGLHSANMGHYSAQMGHQMGHHVVPMGHKKGH